jgi:hypothetical protein
MTMRDRDDEAEERRRQQLVNQQVPIKNQFYPPKRTTATGEEDGRHDQRGFRFKQVPLRVQLRTNAIRRAAMLEAGYRSFPEFFELMLAVYLEKHPIDDSQIPSEEELMRRHLEKRDEDDAK